MEQTVRELKGVFRDMLGSRPSPMFMSRMERVLDEGAAGRSQLCTACDRAEKMVRLFIDIELAEDIGRRWREIMGN